MAESLFDIFGDRSAVPAARPPVARSLLRARCPAPPLGNLENNGKVFSHSYSTPLKPTEPLKKSDTKKSFFVNKGTALQSTPLKLTPFGKGLNNTNKKHQLKIYSDDSQHTDTVHVRKDFEIESEFTKTTNKNDNFNRDLFDDLAAFKEDFDMSPLIEDVCLGTPEPVLTIDKIMEFNYSYEDDFFKDDFSNESIIVDNLNLPSYY